MKHEETLLKTAIDALQADAPEAEQVTASARRVAARLGVDSFLATPAASSAKPLDWSAPRPRAIALWRPRSFGLAFASAFALVLTFFFVYKAWWQVPPGVRAEVESIDGSAYRIAGNSSANQDRLLAPGDTLGEGETLRTSGGGHAVLRLSDGSTVEVNERSVLNVGARGHNMTVALENGAVIVQAAKRTSGHLYIKTPDCRVAVTGTVFSVNAGLKGSRVAVLEGTVHVLHAGLDTVTTAGNQMTTDSNLSAEPVAEQISWSHDRDKYLVLLSQFSTLQKQIAQIPFPQPRYSSDLLARVPQNTTLYISVPNLGDFLNQANQTFHDQLKQSPALAEWWNGGDKETAAQNKTAQLDEMVDKIHTVSQYLGNEVVIVGTHGANKSEFALIADVKQAGLDGVLKSQFPASDAKPGMTVLDEASLHATKTSSANGRGGYALVRDHEAIFSNSAQTLASIDAQLNAGASGFATGDFGKQIAAAYGRGAGIILAADLHQMISTQITQTHTVRKGGDALVKSGVESANYLIAEHREVNGQPENRVDLEFAGARQGIASWLAAPAPIGSLNFVTPNASIAAAALSKDPKSIADDLIAMTAQDANAQNGLNNAEQTLGINFRDDIAANLGGDFLLALDGPVLPTPSWKAVIEVNNPQQLEQALERMTTAIQQLAPANAPHSITIVPGTDGDQTYYAVTDTVTGTVVAQYVYADGYMIVAPSRALLVQAMQAYSTGNSLANSAAFKALLPNDANDTYSAIAYQNLSPVLAPVLTEVSGPTADAVRKLAADARPTTVCVRGEQSRIEAASDSRLFGFDFLALEGLIRSGKMAAKVSGNQHAAASVRD